MAPDRVLSPALLAYADALRRRYPLPVGRECVTDIERLAQDVCVSVEEFPFSDGVLGCTVFLEGGGHTAIREGLRSSDPARWRFTLAHEVAEIVLRRYLQAVPLHARRERVCDAFAAELLLPRSIVQSSVTILLAACDGARNVLPGHVRQLAGGLSRTYGVSLATARISISQCLAEAT